MPEELPGTHIGPYELVQRIEGQPSAVYLARRPEDRVNPRFTLVVFEVREVDARIIEAEVARCQHLDHPCISRPLELLKHGGKRALVLQGGSGTSLTRLMARLRNEGEQVPDVAVFHVGHSLFSALDAVHTLRDAHGKEAPVVHGQLGPHQLMISWSGALRIIGFGMSRVFRVTESALWVPAELEPFLAPEQRAGHAATPRGNVYSAAAIVWSLLTNELPPTDDSKPRSLQELREDLPSDLIDCIDQALEPVLTKRNISAAEVAAVFAEHDKGEGQREMRWVIDMVKGLGEGPFGLAASDSVSPRRRPDELVPRSARTPSIRPFANDPEAENLLTDMLDSLDGARSSPLVLNAPEVAVAPAGPSPLSAKAAPRPVTRPGMPPRPGGGQPSPHPSSRSTEAALAPPRPGGAPATGVKRGGAAARPAEDRKQPSPAAGDPSPPPQASARDRARDETPTPPSPTPRITPLPPPVVEMPDEPEGVRPDERESPTTQSRYEESAPPGEASATDRFEDHAPATPTDDAEATELFDETPITPTDDAAAAAFFDDAPATPTDDAEAAEFYDDEPTSPNAKAPAPPVLDDEPTTPADEEEDPDEEDEEGIYIRPSLRPGALSESPFLTPSNYPPPIGGPPFLEPGDYDDPSAAAGEGGAGGSAVGASLRFRLRSASLPVKGAALLVVAVLFAFVAGMIVASGPVRLEVGPESTAKTTAAIDEPGRTSERAGDTPSATPSHPSDSAGTTTAASASATAEAAAGVDVSELPPDHGYLIVHCPERPELGVYVGGKVVRQGETLEVPCGLVNVRLGSFPLGTWYGRGRSVPVACRSVTQVTMKAGAPMDPGDERSRAKSRPSAATAGEPSSAPSSASTASEGSDESDEPYD